MKIFIILEFNLILFETVLSFVYDVKSSVTVLPAKNEKHKIHFGYSLDLVQSGSKNWLLAGAPKDGSKPVGSIASCEVSLEQKFLNNCVVRPPMLYGAPDIDNFDDQLLGVSVLAIPSSDTETEVWACAPRFQREKEKQWSQNDIRKYSMMLGNCFLYSTVDEFASNRRVIPLEDHKPIFFGREHYQDAYAYGTVYSELGMAIHFDDSTNQILFGAPGSWNWTGTCVITNKEGGSTVMTQPWSQYEPILNDYTGYSLSSGNVLTSDRRRRQYIFGAPRAGEKRSGTVFVVEYKSKSDLERVAKLEGTQTGEYFGAAVLALDVDGDGVQEIVVGSPLYKNSGKGYEEGRISIFALSPFSQDLIEKHSIFGQTAQARFGQSLASLGDLDGDGFGDFAVGAPYEDEGQGAVRIYFGNPKLINIQEPLQTIHAKEVNLNLRGFGISFSNSRIDLDSNQLQDVAIGSHLSGHAVIFRRRPVVTVDLSVTPHVESISVTDEVDLAFTCCLTLRSKQALDSTIDAVFSFKSDLTTINQASKKEQEIFNKTLNRLAQDEENCFEIEKVKLVYSYTPDVQSPPLEFKAEVFQINVESQNLKGNEGILDPREAYTLDLKIPFKTECGTDSMCNVDLLVEVDDSIIRPFVIGSTSSITHTINVKNLGPDPEYFPILKVPIPQNLEVEKKPVQCSISKEEIRVVLCKLQGPLKAGDVQSVVVSYDASGLRGGDRQISWTNFQIDSESSSSDDSNVANNKVRYDLPLKTEADLGVSSTDDEDPKVFRQGDDYKVVDFSQTFQIFNRLRSHVDNNSAKVEIPTHYDGNEFLEVLSVSLKLPSLGGDSRPCIKDDSQKRIGLQKQKSSRDFELTCLVEKVDCTLYRCPKFSVLDDPVKVDLQLRFNPSKLEKSLLQNGVTIASEAHVALPDYLVLEDLNESPDSVFVKTKFISQQVSLSSINKWYVIGAVLVGIIFLVLIVLCMCKSNCFKRKTPGSDDQADDFDGTPEEKETLNQDNNQPEA